MRAETVDQFRAAILAAGLPAPEAIEVDGRLHRFSTSGRRSDAAGWYVLHGDGPVPAGVFGCWRQGISQTWSARPEHAMSAAELEQFRQEVRAARQQAHAERRQAQQDAAARAWRLWCEAGPASPDHPYLVAKGVRPHGLRQSGGVLLVPVMRADGQLSSLQRIRADGTKRFLAGGAMRGGHCIIGDAGAARVVLVAEGFATAASCHEASGWPACVAFNAGNLQAVAQAMRRRFPDALLVIAGDDDTATPGNPGREAATQAALACGGQAVFAPEHCDFNDLHAARGLAAVACTIGDVVCAMGGPGHE